MDGTITEKNYPIRNIWVFKGPLIIMFVTVIFLIFILIFILLQSKSDISVGLAYISAIFILIFIFSSLFSAVPTFIIKTNFHFSLEDKFIVLRQGILRKQNRNVPYGVIQGVFVNQGLFDRIFGLASLTFEDFSQGGRSPMSSSGYVGYGKSRHEVIGFYGNKIHIPGLKKEDAEALKNIILQKMKENPIDDSQSGL